MPLRKNHLTQVWRLVKKDMIPFPEDEQSHEIILYPTMSLKIPKMSMLLLRRSVVKSSESIGQRGIARTTMWLSSPPTKKESVLEVDDNAGKRECYNRNNKCIANWKSNWEAAEKYVGENLLYTKVFNPKGTGKLDSHFLFALRYKDYQSLLCHQFNSFSFSHSPVPMSETIADMAERVVGNGSFGVVFQIHIA
ncbi:hypothetical protein IFM89_024958 [Coptis chinensis]|uniref:Uncharacterized protein n=1 Tax=Coptis chinensis TaxID=261450 RepID=A0A835IQF3_9MAGN|nr:hypothetical protein IFM89_024958 [Coptis chinensis]